MSTSISGSDRLDAEERRELPDSAFGIPETHEFPMPDAAHVRAAEAYFRYAPENKKSELSIHTSLLTLHSVATTSNCIVLILLTNYHHTATPTISPSPIQSKYTA